MEKKFFIKIKPISKKANEITGFNGYGKIRGNNSIEYGKYNHLNISGIYAITCNKSNKIYIGSSKNIQNRIIKHFSELRLQRHPNVNLQSDFNKYGYEEFDVKVLEETNNLFEREQYYQIQYGKDNIYNELIKGVYTSERHKIACANSDKSTHRSKEYREKMSKLKSNKIAKYSLKGEYIETYESSNFICETFGYTRSVILSACNGNKKQAYGFIWRYVDDNGNILNTGRKRKEN